METIASIGILITFLTASLITFTATQNLSEGTQQQVAILQEAKAQLEEMRADDFRGLKDWYEQTGPDSEDFDNDGDTTETTQINNRFTLYDSVNNKYGIGSIVLTDVYDDVPDADSDNWIATSAGPGGSTLVWHGSVVFDDGSGPKIWVIGGGVGGSPTYPRGNRIWYSEDGETWIEADTSASPQMFDPIQTHKSVVFNNRIWVIAGNTGLSGYNSVWSSADGEIWVEETNDPSWQNTESPGVVVFDNKIWMLGGWHRLENMRTNEVWYSEDGETWIEADTSASPQMWSPRWQHASVVFDNKIWVIGGQEAGTRVNDVWYSSDGEIWYPAGNVGTIGKQGLTAVVLDGRIWVIGGLGPPILDEVWYTSDGITWTQATSSASDDIPWGKRYLHASVAYGGKIWVIGGADAGGTIYGDVWWGYGPERMYQADITISWRDKNDRIVGDDDGAGDTGIALDGLINGLEDDDGSGILDSPVHVTGLLVNRGYPAQIYLGRE